jgi:cullin 3
MEGMFNDTKDTEGMMEQFKEQVGDDARMQGIDLTVSVLTTGSWPLQSCPPIVLPKNIQQVCKVFEEFYLNRHNGRQLVWHSSMGSAELRAHFPKKRYMVTVPTYMMTILMLFNEVEKLTYQDIRETTQIPVAELDRCLLTLVMGKSKLLVKSSKGGGGSKSGKEKVHRHCSV